MVVKTDLHFWGTVLNLIKSKSKMKCMGWTRKPASYLLTDTCRDRSEKSWGPRDHLLHFRVRELFRRDWN